MTVVAVISTVAETWAVATGGGGLVAVGGGGVVGVSVRARVGVAVAGVVAVGVSEGIAVGGASVIVAVGSGIIVAVGTAVGVGPMPGTQATNRVTTQSNGTRRVMAACLFCKKLIMLSSFPVMLQGRHRPPKKRMTEGAGYATRRSFVKKILSGCESRPCDPCQPARRPFMGSVVGDRLT